MATSLTMPVVGPGDHASYVGLVPSAFESASSVTANGGGRYTANLNDGWRVGGGLNGGYLLATIGRALSAESPSKPDPLTISAYYTAAATPGSAEIDVRLLRDGGKIAVAAAELAQDGVLRASVLASFGDLSVEASDVRTTAPELNLPPPEDCVSSWLAPQGLLDGAPLMSRMELRFHPDHIGWALGAADGSGVLSAWFRFEDHLEPDPLALLLVVDALPPVTFTFGELGWAPTLELTAHVRARPAPGWLKVTHLTRNIAGGLFEEDCAVWDSAGRLVAQSRQLARLPKGFSGDV